MVTVAEGGGEEHEEDGEGVLWKGEGVSVENRGGRDGELWGWRGGAGIVMEAMSEVGRELNN